MLLMNSIVSWCSRLSSGWSRRCGRAPPQRRRTGRGDPAAHRLGRPGRAGQRGRPQHQPLRVDAHQGGHGHRHESQCPASPNAPELQSSEPIKEASRARDGVEMKACAESSIVFSLQQSHDSNIWICNNLFVLVKSTEPGKLSLCQQIF